MQIEKIEIGKLKPATYNPRKNLQPGDEEFEKLKRSIEEFGYVEPVIWNKRTGNVVGGHQRLKVLMHLGHTEVDCVVLDIDLQKEKALNIALNKISGDWDDNLLTALLKDLQESGFDTSLTGFDMTELSELFDDEEDIVEDEPPEVEQEEGKEPFTNLGDIWELGRHRLMCGDSTKDEDTAMLMNGKRADIYLTGPPYNVNYESESGMSIQNDNMSEDKFVEFLLNAFGCANKAIKEGAAFYIWHAESQGGAFRNCCAKALGRVKNYGLKVLARYEYFNGVSNLIGVDIPDITSLNHIIIKEKVTERYAQDNDLPAFIKYKDRLVQLKDNDDLIVLASEEIETKQEEQKDTKQIIEATEQEKKKIDKQLRKKQKQAIKKKQKNKGQFDEAIELEITQLKKELDEKDKLIRAQSEKWEIYRKEIEDNREILKQASEAIKWVKEYNKSINIDDYGVDNKNKNKYDSMIAAVQGKYGDKKSTLNNQVLRMCNEVKRAINALYYDSMDEVADALNSFRTIDTQTTKAVLDVVLEKTNVQSIGHYYPSNSGFITIEIANKIKGFNGAIYENMKNLHELINACSHNVYNKQDLKEKNDVTKEEFLKLDKEKQKEIITALVRFYQILELTETQKNKIKEIVKQF